MNNAAMNIHVQVLYEHKFSFLLGGYLGMKLLGHMLTQCFTFWGPAKLFYTEAAPFILHFYHQYMRVPLFSYLHQCQLFYIYKTYSHLNRYEVVSHCGFHLHFPNAWQEGNGTPLQYSCLENPMDGGAWWAAIHGVPKSWTWLSDFTFTFHFHALEKEMATHSSVLAWRIPRMGEPGGLLSIGSHRVGQDWSDLAAMPDKEMGIPDHLSCLLRNLYASQEATVRTGDVTTDWFQIGKGVQFSSVWHDWGTELNWMPDWAPRWLSGKEYTCQCRRHGFDPWVGKISWRRKWQPTPVSWLENSMDRGAWRATVHGVPKEWDTTEWLNNNNNAWLMTLNIYSCDYWPFVSSLEKCLFKYFRHFKIGFVCLLSLSCKRFYTFWMLVPCLVHDLLPFWGLSFTFLVVSLDKQNVLILLRCNLSGFFPFGCLCLWCHFKKPLPNP